MEWIDTFGGGAGLGALLTAFVGLLGLIPKLGRTERAAKAAAAELRSPDGTSLSARVEAISEQQAMIFEALKALSRDSHQANDLLRTLIMNQGRRIDHLEDRLGA